MPSKAVVDAVEARLAAQWNECTVIGTNTQGEPPADASPFLVVQYPVANARQLTIGSPGSNMWREEGAFRLVLHVDRGQGIATGLEWADELASLFRGVVFDGVQCFAPSPPVIDDDNDHGNYFVLSVAVPYQFDLIG